MSDSTLKGHAPLSDEVRTKIIQHLRDDPNFNHKKQIDKMSDSTLRGYAPLSDEVRTKIIQHLRDDPNFKDKKQIDEMSDSMLKGNSLLSEHDGQPARSSQRCTC